jgi:hypothetical protein
MVMRHEERKDALCSLWIHNRRRNEKRNIAGFELNMGKKEQDGIYGGSSKVVHRRCLVSSYVESILAREDW